jgi:hypothetical protein
MLIYSITHWCGIVKLLKLFEKDLELATRRQAQPEIQTVNLLPDDTLAYRRVSDA